MLISVVAHFKPGAAAKARAAGLAFTGHLEQPLMPIRLAGPLRDAKGEQTGFMLLIEAQSFAEADDFVKSSPHLEAGLYDRVEIEQLDPEVGRI
jgi:uncharacterized protein YciI